MLRIGMRNPLLPRTGYVASRRWSFWVNTVAASSYLGSDARKALYRRLGLEISPEAYDFGPRCYIHSVDISVGARTLINSFCWFENVGRLSIGEGVAVGPHTVIFTSTHHVGSSASRAAGSWYYLPVTLEDGCWIGGRTLIQPGVTIGHGSIVAAGSVVAKDTEPDWLYGGVPAGKIRRLDNEPARAVAVEQRSRAGFKEVP